VLSLLGSFCWIGSQPAEVSLPRAIGAAVRLYGAERIVCGTDGTEFARNNWNYWNGWNH
jgi:hypothetical protein